MTALRTLATDLQFPEGPVELEDGSIAVVELRGGQVRRVTRDGKSSVLGKTGGGPNGMAWGPGKLLYICNNGGGKFIPGQISSVGPADDYKGGSIQTLDPATGKVETLYDGCDGHTLSSPNDLVFDRHGGFYFTDIGKKYPRNRDNGAIYYAKADGSYITELAHPVLTPNGIGLSADEKTLYFVETETGRLWAYEIEEPGKVTKLPFPSPNGARLVSGLAAFTRYDSLAIDAEGNICIGTLGVGCVTVISPAGKMLRQVNMPDPYVTNICFGGPDRRVAFITLSKTGQLVEMDWPVAGLKLNFQP